MKTGKKVIVIILAALVGSSCSAMSVALIGSAADSKTRQLLATTAVTAVLGAATGLLCQKINQEYLPKNWKIVELAHAGLWGFAQRAASNSIARELLQQRIACSPTLMCWSMWLSSYFAYLGYGKLATPVENNV